MSKPNHGDTESPALSAEDVRGDRWDYDELIDRLGTQTVDLSLPGEPSRWGHLSAESCATIARSVRLWVGLQRFDDDLARTCPTCGEIPARLASEDLGDRSVGEPCGVGDGAES